MKNKILVTGGLGYIGSHTVVELQQHGYEVVVLDNLSNSRIEVLDAITKITGTKPGFELIDLCDEALLSGFFESEGAREISAVIHFAAVKNVGESVQNPQKYYRNNLASLLNLLNCMRTNKVRNLVFSSSCSVYGNPDIVPVTETTPLQEAASPYGNTKKISEDIIRDFARAKEIRAISLRYFNPIGAHPSAEIGELPSEFSDNIMPALTKNATGQLKELHIYGGDYNTSDGTCVRDYIEITDLAKAHLKALERLGNGNNMGTYKVYNLGTGRGVSVLEIVKSFEKVSGVKLNYKIVDRREGDVEMVYADPSLANKELGWSAENDLDTMIATALAWQKKTDG